MPICKSTIQDNYVLPPTIASLIKSSKQISHLQPCKVIKKISNQKKPINKHEERDIDTEIAYHIKELEKCNVIIRKKQPKSQLAQYLHATCMSPVPSTFIRAINNNNFISWPGLTPQLISKHLPKKIATVQGHLKSERQGLQSTKNLSYKEQTNEEDEYFPQSDTLNVRTN